jgi:hypothetical protein
MTMLYLNEPQLLEGVTVYPDTHQENVFYPIPPMPRFRRDENGKPVFHLIKYIGGSDSTAVRKELPTETEGKNDEIPVNCVPVLDGEIAGGLLLFDVVYSVEEENAQKIREQLDQQVRAKYLREGRDVPDGFQIILRQPMWTDGSVQLLMDDQANGLFESVSKLGKPSLMGSNVSSFAVALKPWQSSLVERSVTPPPILPPCP